LGCKKKVSGSPEIFFPLESASMQKYILIFLAFFLLTLQNGCDGEDEKKKKLILVHARAGSTDLNLNTGAVTMNVPYNLPIFLEFSSPVNTADAASAIQLTSETGTSTSLSVSFQNQNKQIIIDPVGDLRSNSLYTLSVSSQLSGAAAEDFEGAVIQFKSGVGELKVKSWSIGGNSQPSNPIVNVPLTINLQIDFDLPVNPQTFSSAITVTGPLASTLQYQFSNDNTTVTIQSPSPLDDLSKYSLTITNQVKGALQETFVGFNIQFYTAPDPNPKFPVISDDALLTKVQEQTFKYFWDFAHPVSGMARERNTSGDIVTSGGSGFGIMSLILGIERNFITRQQGMERLDKILDFLETADRFHGAWSHWINGTTGKVVPFSPNDNGGDLVETSFLIQGLLTMRQYLNASDPAEQILITRINALWNTVEWDWYTQGGQNVLYWHWSPDKAWIMNHQIKGYNEALITYVLAAASATHSINTSVYHQGWASNGSIKNGKTFYNITLPLGFDYGGPLFFAHYSFLGLDPRNLTDTYANYWTQNVNHSKINHAYGVANPKNFVGYSDQNWGLTASDNQSGYSAHSPTNDLGVISPTAALSSFPYTPDESMKALKFFYYTIGDKLWGPYGFYDAFNLTEGWTANSYLAIDQGPIIVMIENYRTGLLWDLFMSSPEVQGGLDKLSFSY
jgi:hypothetical protein